MIDWDRVEKVMLATQFSEEDEKAIDDTAYTCVNDPELAARYIIWLHNALHEGS